MDARALRTLGISAEAASHLDPEDFLTLAQLLRKIESRRRGLLDDAISTLEDPSSQSSPPEYRGALPGPASRETTTTGNASLSPTQAIANSDDQVITVQQDGRWPICDAVTARDHEDQPVGMGAHPDSADVDVQPPRNRFSTNEQIPASIELPSFPQTAPPADLIAVEAEIARYRPVVRECVRDSGISPGVSIGWLSKKAAELTLTRDELEELLGARKDFGAGLPAMMRRVADGVSVQDLYHLYRIRHEAATAFEGPSFSVKAIHEFCETFPEAHLDDEDVAELLVRTYGKVCARMPWMWKYPDDALYTMVQVSNSYKSNVVSSCLKWLGPSRDD